MLKDLLIIIKGAGEMASAVAWRLHRSGFHKLILLDTTHPIAVRRNVCFSEAIYDGSKLVDGVQSVHTTNQDGISQVLAAGNIAVVIDPDWNCISACRPAIVVDAILAKKNLGTTINDAPLVIGLGPGFTAGKDVHAVIETNRGPDCGRVIYSGTSEQNTGIPGKVMGYGIERVVRSPREGIFRSTTKLDARINQGDSIGSVDNTEITCSISGTIRGLIRDGISVKQYTKLADIEPRDNVNPAVISDKGLAIAGGVLEAILHQFN